MRLPTINILAAAMLILLLAACGGGGGGSGGSGGNSGNGGGPPGHGPNDPGSVTLVLGAHAVNTTELANGNVVITFPSALGDHPLVSGVLAIGSSINGLGNLPSATNPAYDITSDGVTVYFPVAGNYNVTVQVADAGDQPQQSVAIAISVPNTNQFSISGEIEDGVLGAEVGVQTDVSLLWNPLQTPNLELSSQVSQAGTGAFVFSSLLGEVDHFLVDVDGGTH